MSEREADEDSELEGEGFNESDGDEGEEEEEGDEVVEERKEFKEKIPPLPYSLRTADDVDENDRTIERSLEDAIDLDALFMVCVCSTLVRTLVGLGNSLDFVFANEGRFKNYEYNKREAFLARNHMVPVLKTSNNLLVYISRRAVPTFFKLMHARSSYFINQADDYLYSRSPTPVIKRTGTSKSNAANNGIVFDILKSLYPYIVSSNGTKLSGRTPTQKSFKQIVYQHMVRSHEATLSKSCLVDEEDEYGNVLEDENGNKKKKRIVESNDASWYLSPQFGFDAASEFNATIGIIPGFVKERSVRGVKVTVFDTLGLGGSRAAGGVKLFVDSEYPYSLKDRAAIWGSEENATFACKFLSNKKVKIYNTAVHGNPDSMRATFKNLNLDGDHSCKELKGVLAHMINFSRRKEKHILRQELSFDNEGDPDLRMPTYEELMKFIGDLREEKMSSRIQAMGLEENCRTEEMREEFFSMEVQNLTKMLMKNNSTKFQFGKTKRDISKSEDINSLNMLVSFGRCLMSYGFCLTNFDIFSLEKTS